MILSRMEKQAIHHHNNHEASGSVSVGAELDVVAQDGFAMPSSALTAGALEGREGLLIHASGDAVGSTTSYPNKVSPPDNAGSQSLQVQCISSAPASTSYSPVAAVPTLIASNGCSSVQEAQEQPSVSEAYGHHSVMGLGYDGPALGFHSFFPTVPLPVGFKAYGDATFRAYTPPVFSPVVAPLSAPKFEVIERQGAAGPPLEPLEIQPKVAQYAQASNGEGSQSTTWLQTPQGRGKSVVRRGRPRSWSAESDREATRKRVKIDELCAHVSPSVFTTTPPAQSFFSQGGMEKLTADEVHDTTVLEPVLSARMSAVASLPKTRPADEMEQSPISVKIIENHLDLGREKIPVEVPERSPSATRCGGVTLVGNQCTHNVKDGAKFCVKHTKTDVYHSKRTDLEGPGGSSRGVTTHTPFKAADMIVFRCRGRTLNGKQCTHNVKDGALYCLKHGDQAWGPPIKLIEERTFHQTPAFAVPYGMSHQSLTQMYSQTPNQVYCQMPNQIISQIPAQIPVRIPAQVPVQAPVQTLVQMPVQTPVQMPVQTPVQMPFPLPAQVTDETLVQTQASTIAPPSWKENEKENEDGAAVPRCVGRTRRTEEQCSFRPKSGSLYCERHSRQLREKGSDTAYDVPTSSSPTGGFSLRRRRRSQEVEDTISIRERKSLSKAKDLLSDVLNAGLLRGKAVSTDGKDLVGWIYQEASKDAVFAETLLTLLSEEKEKLRTTIIEDRKKFTVAKPSNFWQTRYSPNLARSYLEVTDSQKDCVKGNKTDRVQTSATSRDARGTSGTWPSSYQIMRQRSESNLDIFQCALCTEGFPETTSLARHWKEDHKKETLLFQKGMACCECGQEYTNRGGLLRHWKSTHPRLPSNELGVIVCMICDAMFKDFSMLWMHVVDQHSLEFSSADFAQRVREGMLRAGDAMKCSVCGEEFDTQLEFNNHKENVHSSLLSSNTGGNLPSAGSRSFEIAANGNEASPSKFKCKFCGQKFKLLPDLGRHHQAEHRKTISKVSTNSEGMRVVEAKLPPLVKRTPLPNPKNASPPPGKTLPLSEVFTLRSTIEIAEQGEHQVSVPAAMESSSHVPVVAAQQTFKFRHLKTVAREKWKTEEMNVDAPIVLPPAPPPVLPPALPPAPSVSVVAPEKRRRRRKRMESLQKDNLVPMKKKLGRPPKQAVQIVQHMKAVQQERFNSHVPQPAAFRAVDEGVNAISKIPLQRSSNSTGWPSSVEILDAARVACCKNSMYRGLTKKYSSLHPNLHPQTIALLTVTGTNTQWLADTFRCPNQCSPFHGMSAAFPALEVDMAGFSEAPFKFQADHLGPTPLETINIKDVIKGKHLVLYEDLSNCQEPVAIPCVIDEDVLRPCSCTSCRENGANASIDITEPWKCFNYINKRLLDPSLGLDTESSKLGCACGEGRCNPGRCEHVTMFDNDNGEACDKSGIAIRGRFPYDEQGRIILEEGYMVYECNSSCHCSEDCQNRVLQKGVRVKLEVFKSRHKGWAVRAAEPIRCGTFVCEYIGEVVNDREANQRGVRYDQDGCSYLYDIDAHLDVTGSRAGAKPFVIDATKHGNVARFINHSCAPNLINYEVLVESMDCQLAHIGFFARRDIGAGEELAYDYRYKLLPGKGTACHCGAATCRGRLY